MADNMLQIHELVPLGRDLTGTDVLAVDTGALTAKVDYGSLKQEITDDAVKFSAAQSLTDAQKTTARGNIGAASAGDVGDLESALTDPRNLLNYSAYHNGKYYDSAERDYPSIRNLSYFIIPVVSGTKYYISPGFRFLSKQGQKIVDETLTPYEYIADFTGDLYITFNTQYPGWVVTTESNYKRIRPFDAPSLYEKALKQTTGNSTNFPMSQKAVSDALIAVSEEVTAKFNKSNQMLQVTVIENGFTDITPVTGKYYDNSGEHESSSYNYYVVPVVKGETYWFNPRIRMFVIKDSTGVVQSNFTDNQITFTADYTGDAYITVYANQTVTMKAGRTDETLSIQHQPADGKAAGTAIDRTNQNVACVINKNEVAYTNLNTGYMNLAGTIYPTAISYKYTDKIPVVAGEKIYTGKARFVTFFNGNTAISSDGLDFPLEYVKTHEFEIPNNIDGMVVSLYANDTNKYIRRAEWMFTEKAQDEIKQIADADHNDVLAGKKWWACGDSFTEWTTESYQTSEIANIDGLQHYKTYPYWIAKRNPQLTVYNFAVSGQTMAMPAEPGAFANAFSNGKYQQIPNDVDIITLKFGINDNNHRQGGGDGEDPTGYIPIGDVTDTGTASFCGAYNTVLEYLITNHPFAKIGVIVTNGCEDEDSYRTKTIAIAERWGLPWIDENGEARCPAMIRSSNPNVLSALKTLRRTQQAADLAQGNTHPNVNAHKYESTFIEAFLRSL